MDNFRWEKKKKKKDVIFGFRELRDHVDPQDSEAHQEKVIQDQR